MATHSASGPLTEGKRHVEVYVFMQELFGGRGAQEASVAAVKDELKQSVLQVC